jgi:hypothetical protein
MKIFQLATVVLVELALAGVTQAQQKAGWIADPKTG